MKASIITIGNSKGIRISKPLLEESGIKKEVNITAKKGRIIITPLSPKPVDGGILFSRSALAKEWDSPEEDAAWASLQ